MPSLAMQAHSALRSFGSSVLPPKPLPHTGVRSSLLTAGLDAQGEAAPLRVRLCGGHGLPLRWVWNAAQRVGCAVRALHVQ